MATQSATMCFHGTELAASSPPLLPPPASQVRTPSLSSNQWCSMVEGEKLAAAALLVEVQQVNTQAAAGFYVTWTPSVLLPKNQG